MADDFSFSTLRSVYVDNETYDYPFGTYNFSEGGMYVHPVKTGWQVIPNILWEHFVSPKDFYEMTIKYEAVKVKSIECTLFNMIPIQSTLAIQGTSTFSAFNNTVYLMGYNDTLYETPPFPWTYISPSTTLTPFFDNNWNPAYKEGKYVVKGKWCRNQSIQKPWYERNQLFPNDTAGTDCPDPETKRMRTGKINQTTSTEKTYTTALQKLPHYTWGQGANQAIQEFDKPPALNITDAGWQFQATCDLTGVFWDPLNRPDEILELRPGKNAITFSWNTHETDSNIWFNLDYLADLWPYPRGSVNSRDYARNIDIFTPGINHPTVEFNTPGLDYSSSIDNPPPTRVPPPGLKGYEFYEYVMRPNIYPEIPNWRKIPIVPTYWWFKEMENMETFKDILVKAQSKKGTFTNCMLWNQTIKSIFWPGTEYENHKYPPTQWFVKTIPIFDDQGDLIPVQCQVWMKLTIHLAGKPRKSAIYAPTWGPWQWNALYGVDGLNQYNLSGIRGRSGGARRTYPTYADPPFVIDHVPGYLITPQTSTLTPPGIYPPDTPVNPIVLTFPEVSRATISGSNTSVSTMSCDTNTTNSLPTVVSSVTTIDDDEIKNK
ncbi:capsid protein [Chapparvovirus sp.]|nr:capsid protein [Chapparvovirus sp.]